MYGGGGKISEYYFFNSAYNWRNKPQQCSIIQAWIPHLAHALHHIAFYLIHTDIEYSSTVTDEATRLASFPLPPPISTCNFPAHTLTASHSIWSILTLSIPPPGLMKSFSFPPLPPPTTNLNMYSPNPCTHCITFYLIHTDTEYTSTRIDVVTQLLSFLPSLPTTPQRT